LKILLDVVSAGKYGLLYRFVNSAIVLEDLLYSERGWHAGNNPPAL